MTAKIMDAIFDQVQIGRATDPLDTLPYPVALGSGAHQPSYK
ncbi:MAG: hypothetical protein ABSE87_05625 [Terracidiphilus sp.]